MGLRASWLRASRSWMLSSTTRTCRRAAASPPSPRARTSCGRKPGPGGWLLAWGSRAAAVAIAVAGAGGGDGASGLCCVRRRSGRQAGRGCQALQLDSFCAQLLCPMRAAAPAPNCNSLARALVRRAPPLAPLAARSSLCALRALCAGACPQLPRLRLHDDRRQHPRHRQRRKLQLPQRRGECLPPPGTPFPPRTHSPAACCTLPGQALPRLG